MSQGDSELQAIDPRAETRARYSAVINEFRGLLGATEAPVQAFLEAHPELLSPTHTKMWRKLPLGGHVTDFVFREASNDYLLVELEAPNRSLFRKDGQPHHDLVHALSQITDWLRYVEDNHDTAQRELGLTGISTAPRCLVVIGRSAGLTASDRRKLTTIANQYPKVRILTYDDLLTTAKATIENLLGTLSDASGTAKIFYAWGQSKSE